MKWFRFYHDAIFDPKVQSLRGDAYKFWVNLLCIASAQHDRGAVPPVSNIAFSLHLKADRVAKYIDDFIEIGLIDEDEDGRRRVHNWAERQRPSDDVAERVRKAREKAQRNGTVTLHNNGDIDTAADCNVTPSTRERLERCALERELEAPPSGGGSREAGTPPAAGSGEVSHGDCVRIARGLFGESEARRVEAKRDDIERSLGGRFDCYAAALREIDRRRRKPGAKPIGNLHGYCLKLAPDYVRAGPAPAPEPVPPAGPTKAERVANLNRRLAEKAGK